MMEVRNRLQVNSLKHYYYYYHDYHHHHHKEEEGPSFPEGLQQVDTAQSTNHKNDDGQ